MELEPITDARGPAILSDSTDRSRDRELLMNSQVPRLAVRARQLHWKEHSMNKRRVVLIVASSCALLLAFAVFFASVAALTSSQPAAPVAGGTLGEVDLPYPNEQVHTVYIEDVSPDVGSSAQDETTSRYASRWGMVNALAVSHAQMATSPACNYASDNTGVLVEHIAAVDQDAHLITFYYSSDNDWKAVDVSEKTNIDVAKERPTCWTVQAGSELLENVAARMTGGYVYVFTWKAGSDWVASNLSSSLGHYAVSPTTSWNAPAGATTAEHVAFRTQDSDLVLYWRHAGQTWAAVNLSNGTGKKVAGTPTGWKMSGSSTTERIGITDSDQHLIVFTYTPSGGWSYEDVSSRVGNKLVDGRVTAWDISGIQYIAAHSPDDHLLIFRYDSIESTWSVEDVSDAANTGLTIVTEPASWMTESGEASYIHIAAPDDSGHIRHFFKQTNAAIWTTEDISATTGETTSYALTAWTYTALLGDVQRLAAPDIPGFLHVHTLPVLGGWTSVDVSERSAGRIVYAGAPFAGVWISRDYGVTWSQSVQSQPEVDGTVVPGALDSNLILDVIVSPGDHNRVVALADREIRTSAASGAGIYVSQGGGDRWDRKAQFSCPSGIEGPSQVVVAPDDPDRFYVAGGCGIVRSVDAGLTWTRIMTTTNNNDRVWHVAVSGQTGSSATDRVIVACGNGRLWATEDGGQNWVLDAGALQGLPAGFCGKTRWGHQYAAHMLALVPTDPTTVYLAIDHSANGSSYFHPTTHFVGPDGTRCNNPVVHDANDDGQYGAGDTEIWGLKPLTGSVLTTTTTLKFRDLDGDGTLTNTEGVVNDANGNNTYDKDEVVLRRGSSLNVGDALTPATRIKYVDLGYPLGTRGCGEGSLWKGDISDVVDQVNQNRGAWSQLPGPPVYWGAGDSGAVYVYAHSTTSGYLTFFADQATLHVAAGEPTAAGWHRLDGNDASSIHRAGGSSAEAYVHVDPQGFTVSPGFSLTLKPVTDQSFPYNQNSELNACGGGRLWVSTDGGVYHSDNCGASKERWRPAESGLNTLASLNIQGATSLDLQPALYFGVADNDDFYSMDAGQTWNTAAGDACGDCDTWFGDLYQVNRVLRLQPRSNDRKGAYDLFTNPSQLRPDAGLTAQLRQVNYHDGVRPYAVSHLVIRGYRPAVQTIPTGTPPADGDYIAIEAAGPNEHYLRRGNDRISTSGLARYGAAIPTLPPNNIPTERPLWVQASGGHSQPDFYLGDGTHLWRGQDPIASWVQVVPTGTLTAAWRFFANPYDASMIYMLGAQGVYSSTDYGVTWQHDNNLQQAVTANGTWELRCWDDNCLINDMVFDPTLPGRRFAAGLAGVFFTADGQNWFRLLDTRALPSRPRGLWFDPLSDPNDDALFVAANGRGILRLHPIPRTAPQSQPPQPTPQPTAIPVPIPLPPGSGSSILNNGGFEDGLGGRTASSRVGRVTALARSRSDSARPGYWTTSGSAGLATTMARTGSYSIRLGHEDTRDDEVSQTVEIPCDAEGLILSYYYYISSLDNHPSMDEFVASIESEGDGITLQMLTEESLQNQWYQASFDISGYACQPLTVRFQSAQNSQLVTAFFIDDVELLYFNGTHELNLPLVHR